MQNVVGSGAQQQCQAVTTVAADHDKVAAFGLGEAVDFLAWLAVFQMAVVFAQLRVNIDQSVKAIFGLVELLLLQLR